MSFNANSELNLKVVHLFYDESSIAMSDKNDSTILLLHCHVLLGNQSSKSRQEYRTEVSLCLREIILDSN